MVEPRFKAEPVSGVRHFARLRWSGCCIPGCRDSNIVVHHVRSAATSGTGLKPGPEHVINICARHHQEGHQQGWKTTSAKYGVDFVEVARGQAIVSAAMGLLPRKDTE